jgi:hypothetical protein
MRNAFLHTTALDPENFEPRHPPIPEIEAAEQLKRSLEGKSLRGKDSLRGPRSSRAVERGRPERLDDPLAAGWTFVVGAGDPRRAEIAEALKPLAAHRHMTDPRRPLIYDGGDLWAWLDEYDRRRPTPHYVLLAGGPKYLPFDLQSLLGTIASVGRLDFDEVDQFAAYVDKILRLERAREAPGADKAVIFAPNAGAVDATAYSEPLMARPLAARAHDEHGFEVRFLRAGAATKGALLSAVTELRPTLIYTAGHGLAPPKSPLAVQRGIAGAICCQPMAGAALGEWTFQASDVPVDRPFGEGAVVFQFACFGAGVPAESETGSWLSGSQSRLADEDFVPALPKRLLAHPQGPVGFVGHVDEAFVLSFVDPADDEGSATSKTRLMPFTDAVDALLHRRPAGRSLASLSRQLTIGNDRLNAELTKTRRGGVPETPERLGRLLTTFLRRTDAKNYMVLGDPGARPGAPPSTTVPTRSRLVKCDELTFAITKTSRSGCSSTSLASISASSCARASDSASQGVSRTGPGPFGLA